MLAVMLPLSLVDKREDHSDSVIYSITSPSGDINADTNTVNFSSGHVDFIAAGTGAGYLKEKVEDNFSTGDATAFELAAELLGSIIRLELTDYDFPTYDFGGAYEILTHYDNSFQCVPYTIIDSETDTEKSDDGIYDITSRQTKRKILCCPLRRGSLFIVMTGDKNGNYASAFHMHELQEFTEPVTVEDEILEALGNHEPRLTISLIRHSDVNYAILGQNLVDASHCFDTGLSISVDIDLLVRSEMIYFDQVKRSSGR